MPPSLRVSFPPTPEGLVPLPTHGPTSQVRPDLIQVTLPVLREPAEHRRVPDPVPRPKLPRPPSVLMGPGTPGARAPVGRELSERRAAKRAPQGAVRRRQTRTGSPPRRPDARRGRGPSRQRPSRGCRSAWAADHRCRERTAPGGGVAISQPARPGRTPGRRPLDVTAPPLPSPGQLPAQRAGALRCQGRGPVLLLPPCPAESRRQQPG